MAKIQWVKAFGGVLSRLMEKSLQSRPRVCSSLLRFRVTKLKYLPESDFPTSVEMTPHESSQVTKGSVNVGRIEQLCEQVFARMAESMNGRSGCVTFGCGAKFVQQMTGGRLTCRLELNFVVDGIDDEDNGVATFAELRHPDLQWHHQAS